MSTPAIDKKKLKEYATLKSEEKRIAERLGELGPEIREAMRANDADKVETDFGSFTLSERGTWQYSPAVEALQEQEKANGTAKKLVSTILRFTATK